MRHTWLILFGLILCSLSVDAADLTKISRTIAKEPKYQSNPRYALLVFGPEAKFRMWLVFDGDVVYVDRNGNGDLTETGERLEPSGNATETAMLRVTSYSLPQIKDPFTGKKYGPLKIDRQALKKDFVPANKEERERVESIQKNGTPIRIRLGGGETISQLGHLFCAGEASKASILHFDGPLTFRLVDDVPLKRGEKATELRVELTTPGLGRDVYHAMSFEIAPKNLHPVAVIEFPGKKPGSPPIKESFTLKDRC